MNTFGEEQGANWPPSSLHSNVDASLAKNSKLATLDWVVPEGPEEMAVSGDVVSGTGRFTVQVRVAGDESMLPAASLARTEKVCEPLDRPVSTLGDEHGANSPASSLHSNVEPASGVKNSNVAELEVVVSDGPAVMNVSGGKVSGTEVLTVHVRVAGDGSVFPTASRARTENVCWPLVSSVSTFGDEHETNSPASSLHSKVEPGSVEENSNDAVVDALVPEGPEVINVSGATASTVHVRVAGEASRLPAASFALTANVCEPFDSPVSTLGDEHGANSSASSLHSKVEPGSVEENSNDAVLDALVPEGPEMIVVSGGAVSCPWANAAPAPVTPQSAPRETTITAQCRAPLRT